MGNLAGFLEQQEVVSSNSSKRVPLDFDAIRHAAAGSYVHTIFPSVGIMLSGNGKNHQACPLCGGRDRFRCDDIRGDGTWICNQCGAGNGFQLVQRYTNSDAYETNEIIASALGLDATSEVSNEQREQWQSEQIEREVAENQAKVQAQIDAAQKANDLWLKSSAASDEHAYLVRKNIPALDLRQYANDLVIPMQSGNDLVNIQTIAADGRKLFLKGGQVTGAYHVIGHYLLSVGTLLLCEGYATGSTIFDAVGRKMPVIVAFNAGNLMPVAQSLRELYPNHRIIICADDDRATAMRMLVADAEKGGAPKPLIEYNTGIREANKAADAICGDVVLPEFDGKEGTDFNDLAFVVGIKRVSEQIAAVLAAKSAPVAAVEPIVEDLGDYYLEKTTAHRSVPRELLSFPVPILNDLGEWMEGYSREPQQQITMFGVTALASTICGRNYCSEEGNTSSLFMMVLGETGIGKNYIRNGIQKFFSDADMLELLSGSGNTSAGAVYTAMCESPCHIQVVDEVGKQLQSARKQTNGMMAEAFSTLVECYSSTTNLMTPKNYSNMGAIASGKAKETKKIVVHCPAVTFLGLATPAQVYDTLTTVEIEDGFLNRLIVCDVTLPQKPKRRTKRDDAPQHIVDWARAIRHPEQSSRTDLSGVDMGYGVRPSQKTVFIDDDSMDLFDGYETQLRERELSGEFVLPDMIRRWNENAMRVATMLAICENAVNPVVSIEFAKWSILFVEYYGYEFMINASTKVADSDFHNLYLKVYSFIERAGKKGITERRLAQNCRLYASTSPMHRDQVMVALTREDRVKQVTVKADFGGKEKSVWIAEKFIKQAE